MAAAATVKSLEEVDVECTHCGIKMTAHMGSGQRIRYFRCDSCHRWVSSAYADIFRADAKVRMQAPAAEPTQDPRFAQVKQRLERWLSSLEDQDPYRLLGVSPMSDPQVVRDRYRQLAFSAHPDRGGSAERMRALNLAYERILNHQERQRSHALPSQTGTRAPQMAPTGTGTPAR